MNLNNFNDSISILPDDQGVFQLKERQNDTRQKISFDSPDNCVLDVEKMQNHWFKDDHPSLCDFIVLYRKNNKLYCMLVELKGEKQSRKAMEQLQGGKKLVQYLADIWQCQIHEFRGCVFYKQSTMKRKQSEMKKPLEKGNLMSWYKDGPIKIDYKIGQKM